MGDGKRVIFCSLEHPNQDVVVGTEEWEVLPTGIRRAKNPKSAKFNNGRLVLDSEKDADVIDALRSHRDYGTHIKELDEEKLQERVRAQSIRPEQVVCPHCRKAFPDLQDRNQHMQNCTVKNRPKMIRDDGAVQAARNPAAVDFEKQDAAMEAANESQSDPGTGPAGRTATRAG